MPKNLNLHRAKMAKKDEFYTQFEDIQNELNHYKKHFENKVVLCNCDDPFESQFCRFFLLNFKHLKLRRLICTSYQSSPVIGKEMPILDNEGKLVSSKHGYVMDISHIPVANDRGVSEQDIEALLKSEKRGVKKLHGDGDFRSEECIEYLKQADIVVTNPPFSLFREYVAQLVKFDKKFLIIANQNAITYKEIFPLIKENKIWLGANTRSGNMKFYVPDSYQLFGTSCGIDNNTGRKYINCKGIKWFTNLEHKKRHEDLILYKHYYDNEKDYPKYDNYDAINVDKTADIPCDYFGNMGVPITFLDKYNPEQFEIIGLTQRGCHDESLETKKYDNYWEVKQNGVPTGSKGNKTNGNPNLAKNDGKHNYFINKDGHIVQSCYQRILIKKRQKNSHNIAEILEKYSRLFRKRKHNNTVMHQEKQRLQRKI